MRPMYYKRDGTPYEGHDDYLQWAQDFQKERHVGKDTLSNGVWISTVWLGLDHRFGAGRPLIFESMVFAPEKVKVNFFGKNCEVSATLEMIRYSTEEEARLGHKMLCKKWRTFKTAEEVLGK